MRGLELNIGRLRLLLVRWVAGPRYGDCPGRWNSKKFFRYSSYRYDYVRHWMFHVGRLSLSVLWRSANTPTRQ